MREAAGLSQQNPTLCNDARAPVGDDHLVGCHETPSLGHLAAWEKPRVPATCHPCTTVLLKRTNHVQHHADLNSSRNPKPWWVLHPARFFPCLFSQGRPAFQPEIYIRAGLYPEKHRKLGTEPCTGAHVFPEDLLCSRSSPPAPGPRAIPGDQPHGDAWRSESLCAVSSSSSHGSFKEPMEQSQTLSDTLCPRCPPRTPAGLCWLLEQQQAPCALQTPRQRQQTLGRCTEMHLRAALGDEGLVWPCTERCLLLLKYQQIFHPVTSKHGQRAQLAEAWEHQGAQPQGGWGPDGLPGQRVHPCLQTVLAERCFMQQFYSDKKILVVQENKYLY